jgi:hypothetical protein
VTVNPYAPPSAQVADRVEPHIPRPRRVTVAMVLVCIAAAAGLIVEIAQNSDRFGDHTVLGIGLSIVLSIGVTGGLCIAIGARRNWARWVYSLLILLPWLGNISGIAAWLRPPLTLMQIITLGVDGMAFLPIILLFTGPSG